MSTRANPFYRYQNPALGAAFTGVAEAMFPTANKTQSEIQAREAQAAASMALAAERDQDTRGKTIKNDRYEALPTELAQLFLSGGRFEDQPMQVNPDYKPPAPIDWNNTNLLVDGLPKQDIQPMMVGGRTAADQLATALQQMEAFGFRPDQIMDAIGGMQYLQRAGGANPDTALPFAPFAGVNPNAGTALTTAAQDRISARDAREALTQATTVEGMRSKNRLEIEGVREEGRNNRGTGRTGTGGSATTVPTVNAPTAKAIRAEVSDGLKDIGFDNIEPQAVTEVTNAATRLFQDRNSEAFKNAPLAAALAVQMVEAGQVPGVTEVLNRSFFGGESRSLTRTPAGQRPAAAPAPAAPAPARPAAPVRPDIAKVPGVPQGSRIGKQSAQGWEVLDRNGNLIGHIQE